MSRIEMVISDFGGVLTTPLDLAFATLNEDVGIEREYFVSAMKAIFEDTGIHPLFELECGRITQKAFEDQLADEVARQTGTRPDVRDFGLGFFNALDPNPGMLDLIREVRRDGYRTALLTNNVKEWEPLWRSMLPVDELFETVVDSAFVGCRKPDPRIYHLTLERVDLPPEACIFIDDMEVNCKAAEEIGIHAVHFRETAQARAEVHALLKSN